MAKNKSQLRTEKDLKAEKKALSVFANHAVATNGIVATIFLSKTMGVSLDLQEMVAQMDQQTEAIKKARGGQTESILYSQALTLNAIFLEMARRAALNMNEHIHATEAYMRMALRAQNQVRLTLETINNIKNPPVVIAKQANIASGPQQVNNVFTPQMLNEQIQLSEVPHELHQNARASCTQG